MNPTEILFKAYYAQTKQFVEQQGGTFDEEAESALQKHSAQFAYLVAESFSGGGTGIPMEIQHFKFDSRNGKLSVVLQADGYSGNLGEMKGGGLAILNVSGVEKPNENQMSLEDGESGEAEPS